MMYEKIKADIKEAMKNKDVIKRDCLKMVIDKARAIQKEKNPVNAPEIIPDEVMIQAIQKEHRQLAQTLDSVKGKNEDKFVQIAQTTTHKMAILSAYLPTQMTREEVEKAVSDIFEKGKSEFGNFGMVMKAVMAELKGKADNKLISEVVREVLEPYRDKFFK